MELLFDLLFVYAITAVSGTAVAALYGGGAVYLLSLSALRWRVRGRRPSIPRLALAAGLMAAAVVVSSTSLPPLTGVAVLVGAFLGLVIFDAIRYGRTTREMRVAR